MRCHFATGKSSHRCPCPHLWKCTPTIPTQPETLGEHIQKRRIEKHLLQAQSGAKILGDDRMSIQNWERAIYKPNLKTMGETIKFLGYNPEPEQAIPQ